MFTSKVAKALQFLKYLVHTVCFLEYLVAIFSIKGIVIALKMSWIRILSFQHMDGYNLE